MRGTLSAAIMLGLLAACSADHTPDSTASTGAMPDAPATKIAAGTSAPGASLRSSYAGLPDRGELVRYDPIRSVKRSGAYTAYPVALSEAHALNAMQTGEMVINAPNGEPIRLSYERHVEHPDGNWSWIGRDANGADAVVTFGEKAVYGSIPQGSADSLRLTMSGGQAYLVATDRSKLAGTSAVRRSGTDQMIPPKGALTAASGRIGMGAAPPTASAATASGPIDVLLGYTAGFAQAQGSDSAAVTRLFNMIDITNAAYSNSGIARRVRLVGTLKVDYADDTDNGDALEKLTGYQAGDNGGEIDSDPAFAALRAMRNEKGADLVSLVRDFRAPESNGCGIAWLIGGGETSFTSGDEGFGYSVISDGIDIDEGDGNTYFCRDETLAHELGHNMGQAHNEADSDSSGVHPYSYGYRETATDGFYTVMAYPLQDSDQNAIRYFANPLVKFIGRATGVANTSDNVRSLAITMPIVAAFRATVVPLPGPWNVAGVGDTNADGRADLIWHNAGAQRMEYWLMNGAAVTSYGGQRYIQAKYEVAGVGDFNGDGRTDIVWQDDGRSQVWVWLARASGTYSVVYLRGYPAGWNVVGVGDSNKDGRADIFWHNPTSGKLQAWRMNGAAFTYGPVSNIGAYQVAAIDDFTGDGRADIIWTNTASTQVWQWQGRSDGGYNPVYVRSFPTGWGLAAAGDINGDGRSDLCWQNTSVQRVQCWFMNGAAFSYGKTFFVDKKYSVAGVGDLNGDGRKDLVWRDQARSQLWDWQSNSDGTFNVLSMRRYPSVN